MPLPRLLYGTAWKKDATSGLVAQALAAGYRAIDTANQLKHYSEALVGDAVAASKLPRAQLYLQSKFTDMAGQDERLPYDPRAPLDEQVRSSFASSLEHLRTDYLDAYLLHGPTSPYGMEREDWEIWGAMEELQLAGKTRLIGASNISLAHLLELQAKAKVKPAIVQNRCYAQRGWDEKVREYCGKNGIVYQGFSLLTANPQVVGHPAVRAIARRLSATPAQVVFRFAVALGITPLTGTTDPLHMREDLEALALELSEADVEALSSL